MPDSPAFKKHFKKVQRITYTLPSTITLLAVEEDTACKAILPAVERDTAYTSILLAVERDTACTSTLHCKKM
jgi:hypothetical protein